MPIFTALGLALGSTVAASAGAGIGAFGVGLAAAGAAGATIAGSMGAFSQGSPQQQQLATGPTAAETQAMTAKADEDARKESMQRRAARTRTLLSGPQGALGTASTDKKVLLGG